MKTRSLVIIPTYEESANIAEALRRTRESAPDADVLVVDDNSPDHTADAARDAAAALGRIDVLERRCKDGLGNAYRAGFAIGLDRGYDAIVEMDADGSHDPAIIPALLAEIARGADLAIGSRYVPGGATPGWPARRRLLSRAGNRYAGWVLGLGVHDTTSGFRAYSARMLRSIDALASTASGYGFQIELTHLVARHGGVIREVPISFVDRTRGASKMSTRITAEALLRVTWWAARDRAPRIGNGRGRAHTDAVAPA